MKKVFMVDDAANSQITLKKILVKNGFEVVGESEAGLTAVEKYSLVQPDIVIISLSIRDGITAIKKICAVNVNAKIVVITVAGKMDSLREAVAAGASGFIVKPYIEEVVIKTLQAVLSLVA